MKFNLGDEIDLALTTSMQHEMLLCQEAFHAFVHHVTGTSSPVEQLRRYNSYTRFLHHLYEFYVACFKRDANDTANLKHTTVEKLLNAEVRKLLRNRREAIRGGYAPAWENHISVYEVAAPETFASRFRMIRNSTAHVDYRRALNEVSRFYAECHLFAMLLYNSGVAYWSVQDVAAVNWKAIGEFPLPGRYALARGGESLG